MNAGAAFRNDARIGVDRLSRSVSLEHPDIRPNAGAARSDRKNPTAPHFFAGTRSRNR